MKTFSLNWNSSTKPNKQRKYRFNAPLHRKGAFLHAHLSKELRAKYGLRALRLRAGDKVRIMRGQYRKQEGKVEEIDVKNGQIFISKIEHTKKDGSKARHPLEPSNLLIVELNTDDKKRMEKLSKGKEGRAAPKAAVPRPAAKTATTATVTKTAQSAKASTATTAGTAARKAQSKTAKSNTQSA